MWCWAVSNMIAVRWTNIKERGDEVASPTRVQPGYDRFDFNLAANGNQLLFHASAITVRMPPHVPAQPTVFVTAVAAKPFQSISDQWA
jgi:hypothetical protein